MLKRPASIVLDTREAYLVNRRSFPDSDVSRTTKLALLSILLAVNWMTYAREAAILQPRGLLSYYLRPGHVPSAVDPFHV